MYVFVEKILRVQPNIQKIYLLLRAADDKSASQRLQNEIIGKDLFRVLKEEWGSNFNSFITQKIVLVPGDISLGEDLGVKEQKLRDEMWSQLDAIVNLSATTNFDERYDIALITNTFGAKHVVCFAKKCIKLQLLDHAGLIPETPYTFKDTISGVSGLDIDEEKHIVQKKLNELRIEEATDKAITEAMKDLGMKRTIDGFILTYAKGRLPFFLADPNTVVDLIPADMVVNAMLVAMVAHANQPSLTIYQIGTSKKNPITYGDFRDYKVSYFKRKPWIGKDGLPVKVGRIKILGSMTSFHIYVAFHYLLPLQGLKFANSACGNFFDNKYWDLKRKVKSMMRLMELYGPYLFFKGIFDDTNTEKLQMAFKENRGETHLFYFDPKVTEKELFRVLKENLGSNFNSFLTRKIVLVVGDISLGEDLGVKEPKLRQEMWSQLDVIVNLAATTNFDERYDVALGTNTLGEMWFVLPRNVSDYKFLFMYPPIPADMVVNGMLVAMAAHATQPSLSIYHIGSSKRNPITYSEFRDYNFTYFKRRPWIGRNGEPVKALAFTNSAFGKNSHSKYADLKRKVNFMMRLMKLYKPYLFFGGIFDDQNTEKLQMAAQKNSEEETHLFYFDPQAIDWEDYFLNAHFPGVQMISLPLNASKVRYDVALGTNTLGAEHVVRFAKKCVRLQKAGLIPEAPCTFKDTLNGVSGLDVNEEKKIVQKRLNELITEEATDESITEAMKDLGLKRLDSISS
ncbi:hypothetical protein Tsubulata_020833 [Turnera subulata]|uniref:Fatty acyl-CoA reductase n=1 Tax=Turnera subulata TaxID=218843 RepID=A0A9Q0J4R5_9ROSI|nr:hypothetical protein Tsubulata_020833 [Turnera subulata]